jgi:hypothetical protein
VPDPDKAFWSQETTPNGNEAVFTFRCVATNLTPNVDVSVLDVNLRGIKGNVSLGDMEFLDDGTPVGDETLTPHKPIGLRLNAIVACEPLPPGPKVVRVVIRDQLGQRHRSPKVTFRPAGSRDNDGR